MQTIIYPDRSEWAALTQRPVQDIDDVMSIVTPIVNTVRREGDQALRHYTRVFDRADPARFLVSAEEFDAAQAAVAPALRTAIETAKKNIEAFHVPAGRSANPVETMPGVVCWKRLVPIERVGLYVPGGATPLFSTALMLGVPARLAGCPDVVLCTPPREDGSVAPEILVAARMSGIDSVYRVGGAQAIAAMAYGTESIPRVFKIFGPGNQYVTAAKQLALRAGVSVDMPAGPSELLVIADDTADPEFVAADLLSQAEHGPDSQVIVVTTDRGLADDVVNAATRRLESLPRRDVAARALESARAIVVREIDDAVAFSNLYAPEHLILSARNADALSEKVTAAGSVFIGPFTPEAAGDYASGTNHTLPTNGAARAWSGLSTEDFMKSITFQKISEEGLRTLGPVVERMASAEKLDAHGKSVRVRLERLEVKR
jgi:histidinol dehydrogenase